MNNSELIASGESNWKESWIAPHGSKEFSQTKTIMRGWHNARTTNLEENGARLREKSSSVFKSKNDDEKHHHELFRHSERIKSEEVESTMKRIWKILEKGIWLMIIHSYVKLSKKLGIAPEKEESGKILEKDLWVRAHSKDTPLNDYSKERLHRLS